MAVALAVMAGGAAVTFGSASASALSVEPFPGGTEITFNSMESAVIANLNLGPVLSQAAIGWSPEGKADLGEMIGRHAQRAGGHPSGLLSLEVVGSITDPEEIWVHSYGQ
ncbi:hypothetical protein [Nocardia sp. CNY236]|uniref:hypothetical protein n=1 Tax=Nocardia sp. CNY236 TaxID=1169152 RepID=UPI00048F70C9|nr:hypothetical protein [Nocardia sp. CNY236]